MPTVERLLSCTAGLVEAPAGCGKTELLARAVRANEGRRLLVLTHTRAGAWALARRIAASSMSCKACVATLDGWALRLLSLYPVLSGFVRHGGGGMWEEARVAAAAVLGDMAVKRRIAASYSRVLVDEYQDCTESQHAMVLALAAIMPTAVVGDPMQRIFGFGGARLPGWDSVKAAFPLLGTLNTPWRWDRHGEGEFGRWVLRQRELLLSGGPIDLGTAPPNVEFIREPAGEEARAPARQAAIPPPGGGGLLVITAATDVQQRRQVARTGMRLALVEPVSMPELPRHAAAMRRATGMEAVRALLTFMAETTTGVSVHGTLDRLSSLGRGTSRRAATPEELALLAFAREGVFRLGPAMAAVGAAPGRWTFRPELLEAMQTAVRAAGQQPGFPFETVAASVRDRRIEGERRLPHRAVGSTLLLKGLEADRAVVFDVDTMSACDLYVAISRASRFLRVVGTSTSVRPAR